MTEAHRIKLNPTPEQAAYFRRASGVARFSWNWALNEYKRRKEADEKIDWNEIKKERAGQWFLTVVVECATKGEANLSGSVGVDFGLKALATPSVGEVVEPQACFRQSEKRLKGLQRGLARKKDGSRNRAKAAGKIARLHQRIADQRADLLHKFTTHLCTTFAVVCIEDLNLIGLCQTRLAKSFHDAGIGEAVRQLEYKSRWHGGIVQKVGRYYASSKLCSRCGVKNELLKLSDREWDCHNCGAHHDRDFNAAVNIELEGLRLLAGSVATSASTPVDVKALACVPSA